MDYGVYIEKRTSEDIVLDVDDYTVGMKNLLSCLINDLEKYLDKEGRYFGITVKYIHSMRTFLSEIIPEEEKTYYEKHLLFLYKPIIMQAYKKYLKKRLSKADCIICISRSICDVILRDSRCSQILSIYEILDKLYENIRNQNKDFIYYPLTEIMQECIEAGKVGLYELEKFSILEEEIKRKIKPTLTGSGVRIDKSFDNEVTEISWTEE